MMISEWANKYRKLSSEASAEPGDYSTDKAPYQKGIMDAVLSPDVELVAWMAPSQVGKSETVNNIIGYLIDHDPCPILMVQPSIEEAESYSKDRIFPMIRDTPVLRKLFNLSSRSGDNTIRHKKFPGGNFTIVGANSPAGLASKPKRALFGDELDRWPRSAGEEGDPWSIAVKRTVTFFNRIRFAVSSPTVKGKSKIEDLWEISDKRRYFMPCPHCNTKILFDFKQLSWQGTDASTTVYSCQECSAVIDENEKYPMLHAGSWIAELPFNGVAGFHLNALYSPFQRWSEIVKDYLIAMRSPNTHRVWINTTLGEPYEEKGENQEWKELYNRREVYRAQVPQDVLCLFMGVDLQKDRIEVQIVGFTRDKRRYIIDYRVLRGNIETDEPFDELEKVIHEQFTHESGHSMGISVTAVDSGNFTLRAYNFVKKFSPKKVLAIKGVEKGAAIIYPSKSTEYKKDGKKIPRGLRLWLVGTDAVKDELFGALKIDKPTDEALVAGVPYPQYYIHFPKSETGFNADEQFFKQLTSEALISRTVKGVTKWVWVRNGERNEGLDTHVYARAAASFFGVDRAKDSLWDELELIYGNSSKQKATQNKESKKSHSENKPVDKIEKRKRISKLLSR